MMRVGEFCCFYQPSFRSLTSSKERMMKVFTFIFVCWEFLSVESEASEWVNGVISVTSDSLFCSWWDSSELNHNTFDIVELSSGLVILSIVNEGRAMLNWVGRVEIFIRQFTWIIFFGNFSFYIIHDKNIDWCQNHDHTKHVFRKENFLQDNWSIRLSATKCW